MSRHMEAVQIVSDTIKYPSIHRSEIFILDTKPSTMAAALLCITPIILLPLLTAAQGVVYNCVDVALQDRYPCGAPGISYDACRSLGCCYDPRYVNVPACYVRRDTVAPPVINVVVEDPRRKELEAFCLQCRPTKTGGILGVVGDILGTNRPRGCEVCGQYTKRTEHSEDKD
ncbi:hypothetical protein GDO81_025303 [Engystomops pustulosus]|uniref:P-type domain-containing protein n=1 Tax=Engystomops pustulosus TaxID=76066 RepID=A0AAV6Z1U9_ENGPU|nr:hypothetical protein GDO81_025303 [Engystomops pustulosus]